MLKCRLIDIQAEHKKAEEDGQKRYKAVPGDMWYADWYWNPKEDGKFERTNRSFLSTEYANNHSDKRAPIVVVCPDGTHWTVDGKANNGQNGSGWKVVGEAPDITCTPSIKTNGYHGYLQDGFFTKDLEGRSYNQQ
jgi:hypothetical protein